MRSRAGGRSSGAADAVIVGAGVAGLTCGVALADEGLRVVVLERSELLGGRARSCIEPVTGDPLPLGPHVFLENYSNLRAFIERLGTASKVVWEAAPALAVTRQGRIFESRLDRAPPPFHFASVLWRRPEANVREVLANLPALLFALQLDERDVVRLDELDAAQVLTKLGVPKSSFSSLWSFIARSILNIPLTRCSAGAFFRFCHFLLSRPAPAFGFATSGLGDVFAPAARAVIERAGGQVQTSREVQSVLVNGGRACGVKLSDGSELPADIVVIATPAHVAAGLLPEAWTKAHPALASLAGFEPVPYTSVFLWFDRKLTRRRLWARSYRASDLGCDFYDFSNIYRGWSERPSVIAANIIDSDRVRDQDDGVLSRRILAEIAEVFPDASPAHVTHSLVRKIPMAVHAPKPGFERLRPGNETAIAGLLLAGDWTRTGLPSSMESAARSGWLAAEQVLEGLGRVRSLAQPLPTPAVLPELIARACRALELRPVDAIFDDSRPWALPRPFRSRAA